MAYGDNYTNKKKKDTEQSRADVQPPTQSLALKDVVNKPTTTNLTNKANGKVTGFEYAPGKFILPAGNSPTQEQQMQVEAQKKTAQTSFDNQNIGTPDLSNVGQLSPEQQAMINAPVEVDRKPNLKQIGSNALEQGVYGALAGAGTGGLIANIPGAIIVGAAGAVGGAVKGTFAAYKYKDVNNVKNAEDNFSNAKESINGAIVLARRGGAQDLSENDFNRAKAGILRTQAEYKALEKNREWATNIKDKQSDLQYYIDRVLPRKEAEMRLALLKPNPDYVDAGVQ